LSVLPVYSVNIPIAHGLLVQFTSSASACPNNCYIIVIFSLNKGVLAYWQYKSLFVFADLVFTPLHPQCLPDCQNYQLTCP
jgi:hypothetical protein